MSNNLTKVEPHAKRLEDAADRMDKDGIGGHATRGHAAVLRDMASSMRADASVGKLPHIYNGGGAMFGAADNARLPRGRLSPLRTPAQAVAANPEHEGTIKQLRGEGRRMGYELADDKIVNRTELEAAFAKHPDQTTRRLAWQLAASRIGILG
jgi:hypothetical protein